VTRNITLTDFERRVTRFVPEIRRAYVRALQSAALRLNGIVVQEIDTATPHPAVSSGELRGSVDTELVEDGGIVSVSAPHAPMMEYGTRPFTPPLDPLVRWVVRKKLAGSPAEARQIARAIQRKIARDGIAPRGYMAKAFARLPPILRAEIITELSRMAASSGSR
jgi:hypothetical protein